MNVSTGPTFGSFSGAGSLKVARCAMCLLPVTIDDNGGVKDSEGAGRRSKKEETIDNRAREV